MPNNIFLKNVFSKGNTNILISDEINIEQQVRIIIEDIQSGGNSHIELDVFYDQFDIYRGLQHEKNRLQATMRLLSMEDAAFHAMSVQVHDILQMEKKMRIQILELALSLEKMRDSEKMLQIKEHFKQGQLKKIDSELPEMYLLEKGHEFIHNEHKIWQVSERLIDNSNEFEVKAQITNLNYELADRFEKAVFYFEKGLISAKACKVEGHSLEYQFRYGDFLHIHRQFEKAQLLYEASLKMMKGLSQTDSDANDSWRIANILNNLANLHSDTNRFDLAEPLYLEALKIRQKLAKMNPSKYLLDVATLSNNIGEFYRFQNEFPFAQSFYETSVKILKQLVKVKPQIYSPHLATTLNNLAILHKNSNKFDISKSLYQEALTIRRQLVASNSQIHLPEVAKILNNLGNLHKERNEFRLAQPFYKEALEIYRSLALVNPQIYKYYLAGILSNAAGNNQDNIAFAYPLYQEALEIYRLLATVNPQIYLLNVAGTLNSLASLYISANQIQLAQSTYQEILQIYQQLGSNPAHTSHKAMALVNFSMFYKDQMPNQDQSLYYAEKAFKSAMPFVQHLGMAQRIVEVAKRTIKYWGLNPDTFLNDNKS